MKPNYALLIGMEAPIAMEMMNLLAAASTSQPIEIEIVLVVSVKHKY
jgi:hypothetical protein